MSEINDFLNKAFTDKVYSIKSLIEKRSRITLNNCILSEIRLEDNNVTLCFNYLKTDIKLSLLNHNNYLVKLSQNHYIEISSLNRFLENLEYKVLELLGLILTPKESTLSKDNIINQINLLLKC